MNMENLGGAPRRGPSRAAAERAIEVTEDRARKVDEWNEELARVYKELAELRVKHPGRPETLDDDSLEAIVGLEKRQGELLGLINQTAGSSESVQ